MSETGWVQVGTVCVDSAAILIADPAYASEAAQDFFAKLDEWHDVDTSPFGTLTVAHSTSGERVDVAYCTGPGEGDGEYPVFERRTQDDRVAELKIVFLPSA